MKPKHRFLTYLLASILVLVLAAPMGLARAQDAVSLASLTIRVWPEYDQPAALVFYIGKVVEGTALPVELRFQLPPAATLNAAAYLDDQTGSLLTAATKVDGNIVTVTSPNGSFHLEFYDAGLKIEGAQRTYSLVWQGDYPVQQLTLEAEQPVGARDMTTEPAGGTWAVDSNNLQSYVATQSGLPAGQQVTLSMSYAKSDNSLTVDTLAPASSTGPAPATSASTSNTWQIAGLSVLIAVLLAVIGGFAIVYFRRRRGTSRASAAAGGNKRFCTGCGHAAGTEDRFCRYCGARLD